MRILEVGPLARSCIVLAVSLLASPVLWSQEPPDTPAPSELRLACQEAVEMAVRNNLDLRQSMLDERIRQERVREALGTFDPAVFTDFTGGRRELLQVGSFPEDPSNPLSPTVTRLISQGQDELRHSLGVRGVLQTGLDYRLTVASDYLFQQEGSEFNPIYTTSATLTFTQPILRAAWSAFHEAPVELARIEALSAHQVWRGLARDKIMEVQQAYFNLVFAIEDAAVKKTSERLAWDQIDITRKKYRAGAVAEVEITTAESAHAGREADLVTANAAVIQAEDRLRRLIMAFDKEHDWDIDLVPTDKALVVDIKLKELDEILRLAERSEPTILEARLATATAELELEQRKSEALPQLNVTGNVGVRGIDDDLFESHKVGYESSGAFSWSLGLSFEYPLGNREAESRVIQAELQLRRAKVGLQNARIELAFQVRKAVRDIGVARESVRARKNATELAAKQLENERLKLDLRTSTNFQVFEVEEEHSQRQTDEIRAMIDYRLAILELSRAAGLPLKALLVEDEAERK